MTTTTNVKQVKMNIMTQAQYDAITPVETELYAITDAELVTIDSALSASSENPVQNKVVYTALNGKQDTITSSAMLSSDLVDDTNHTHKFATSAQLTQIGTNQTDISTINGKIPSQASTSNQLADKNFVNSSIATNTANFIGTFNSVAELEAYSGTVTNNDYAFVATTDTAGNTLYDRYKYTTATTPASWEFEYELNNSSFTSDQWAAINSGANTTNIGLISTALQPGDVTSTYSSTGTDPVNGTAVASAISGLQAADTAVTHTASTAVGSSTTPVYVASDGTATALSYTIEKSVPSNAVFTDTTYSNFTGADSTTGGAAGLVPAPSAGDEGKYLKGDGTWGTVASATVDQTFDGTSANAQSGVAIEGELANYVKSSDSDYYISNSGNEIMMGYMDDIDNPTEASIIQITQSHGVLGGSIDRTDETNPLGFASGVTPEGLTLANIIDNDAILLSVENNNLAVNGNEVQTKLVSGTNIKTINNNSLLGSGNITIDSLPSQSGQSGKFLTTNGTAASWSTISIPTVDQTFNSSSANAQSGVAIAGELANYLQASNSNVTFDNNGTIGSVSYADSSTGEMYGTFIGQTQWGDGVMMGAVNPNGYLLGVAPSGINIIKGTTTSATNGIALTVTNNNTLAIGGDEVATQTWVGNQGYITSAALSTLTDVALSSPTQGQNLTYDATLGKWKNTSTTATVAWGGITGTLADQTDLNTALGGKQATLVSGTNIKTINSTSLLGSGNITIDSLPSQSGQSGKYLTTNGTTASWSTISMPTVDQTYDGTSINAQSGVAIAGAGFLTSIPSDYLQNTATATNSLTILGTTNNQNNSILIGYGTTAGSTNSTVIGNTAVSGGSYATALGYYARANDQYTTAIGNSSYASYQDTTAVGHNSQATAAGTLAVGSNSKATAQRATSIGYSSQATQYQATALGYEAKATANSALQIGTGTNSTANTLQVGSYTLLNTSTGLIPDARISSNIARTSAIPTVPTNISAFTNDSGYITGITSGDVTTALGFTPYNATNPNGYISSASLSTLTDVALSSPTQGQNLTYDATAGKWKNTSTTATVAWGGITGTLADQTDLNTALGGKQATLVSGTNIKTINSTSLLGSGDIAVLQNTATGTGSLTLLGTATSSNTAINIGYNSSTTTGGTVAIGANASTSGTASISIGANTESSGIETIAIGDTAKATANNAIQIGYGTNNTANKFKVRSHELLDLSTGLIPDARISSNIARTSDIPSITVDQTYDSTSANAQSGVAIAGAGFLTSSDITNMVTTDTDQNITGTKTFVGQKKIGFKQNSSSDKLGFTLYNNSGTEKGYLEYNPSNTVDSVPLMTLGNYATASGGLTHVGFRKYSSISGANGAYNLLAPLISDAKTPFNLTTTYTNFYLPLGFTDGTTTVKTAKSGMVDISSLLPDVSSYLQNTATGSNALTILGAAQTTGSGTNVGYSTSAGQWSNAFGNNAKATGRWSEVFGGNITVSGDWSVGIGHNNTISGNYTVAIGANLGSSSYETTGNYATCLGCYSNATADSAIQIGYGINSTANSLSIGFYNNSTTHYNWQLLDGTTGLIPDARISSNIARTSQITTPTYDSTNERITW